MASAPAKFIQEQIARSRQRKQKKYRPGSESKMSRKILSVGTVSCELDKTPLKCQLSKHPLFFPSMTNEIFQFCNEGSTNFRSSAVEDHARSETHLRAVRATTQQPNPNVSAKAVAEAAGLLQSSTTPVKGASNPPVTSANSPLSKKVRIALSKEIWCHFGDFSIFKIFKILLAVLSYFLFFGEKNIC